MTIKDLSKDPVATEIFKRITTTTSIHISRDNDIPEGSRQRTEHQSEGEHSRLNSAPAALCSNPSHPAQMGDKMEIETNLPVLPPPDFVKILSSSIPHSPYLGHNFSSTLIDTSYMNLDGAPLLNPHIHTLIVTRLAEQSPDHQARSYLGPYIETRARSDSILVDHRRPELPQYEQNEMKEALGLDTGLAGVTKPPSFWVKAAEEGGEASTLLPENNDDDKVSELPAEGGDALEEAAFSHGRPRSESPLNFGVARTGGKRWGRSA